MARPSLGIVLLTFNSAGVVARTVSAARRLSEHIVAVDSGSTDGTRELLTDLGCEVLQRPFRHYADQRNWAIDSLSARFEWQLHLDADEVPDAALVAAVERALMSGVPDVGYLLHRRMYFMGRLLRFGNATSWHLRLFRSGAARCEDRLYDQHFVSSLPSRRLNGWIDDLNVGSLSEWTAKHNRWSTLEAEELRRGSTRIEHQVPGRWSDDPRERRRLYKGLYYRLPGGLRAVGYFLYCYLFRLGFLDGAAGLYFALLQGLWFRVLVDAKMAENDMTPAAPLVVLPSGAGEQRGTVDVEGS
jgi:glycosyltransferase involved in cell wall biosynthesis